MYCHNFFVSEELFSSAQAEGFTVQLQTDERGVDFGLSSANVKVVDGECVYLVVDHSCQWHPNYAVFTMQKFAVKYSNQTAWWCN